MFSSASHPLFPVNREKYRENHEFKPDAPTTSSLYAAFIWLFPSQSSRCCIGGSNASLRCPRHVCFYLNSDQNADAERRARISNPIHQALLTSSDPARKTISMGLSKAFDEKTLHRVFDIGLILKGIIALLEILAGIVAYFITQHFLLNLVLAVFHEELERIRTISSRTSSSSLCKNSRSVRSSSHLFTCWATVSLRPS